MELTIDWLRLAAENLGALLLSPFLYIALVMVWWHSRQSNVLQRRLFHVRLRGALPMTAARVAAGFIAGFALSALGFAAGAPLTAPTLVCVWAATFVLALFKLRYVCLAYAAGALSVVQAVLGWTGVPDGGETGDRIWRALTDIDAPSLLLLAGLLHIAEALLVRLQGARYATPLFLEGKRGKPIGAYALSGLWPVPLLWLVPAGGGSGLELPWTPLFGMGGGPAASVAGWTLVAFPVLIGFTDRTETRWPEAKAKETSGSLLLYGIVIAGLAVCAAFWEPLTIVAGLAAFGLHEGLVLLGRLRERGRQPVYVQDGRGVVILAVLPGTPAAEMGLLAGETVSKANGVRVRSKEELHAALQLQPAFSKLEVLNRDGNVKFAQRAKYAGEHHQLGLILAPDEDAEYVAAPRSASLRGGIRQAGARLRRGSRRGSIDGPDESTSDNNRQEERPDGRQAAGVEEAAASAAQPSARPANAEAARPTSARPSAPTDASVPGLPPRGERRRQ
ncbi:PDZ domain-containing protein [Cohnella sp. 56]|uniref:PDZ domain-containing protein n=1 Tax=Cohnella sp. 56 TaxID=3113722 RepID=UPI0030EA2EDD